MTARMTFTLNGESISVLSPDGGETWEGAFGKKLKTSIDALVSLATHEADRALYRSFERHNKPFDGALTKAFGSIWREMEEKGLV